MKLKFIIGIIIAIFSLSFVSCDDGFDHEDEPITTGGKLPTNKVDSIIIVKIYKAMGCDNWPGFDKVLREPEKWSICCREFDTDKGEHRVNQLRIDLSKLPISKDVGEIVLPDEVGHLDCLMWVDIKGTEKTRVRIPKSIFKCDGIQYFYADFCSFDKNRIPDEVFKVRGLSNLSITNSTLMDANIEALVELESLYDIDLSGNSLMGEVPKALCQVQKQTIYEYSINLENNYYTSIDWETFTDNPLERYDVVIPKLNGNCLSGEIPEEVFHTIKWCYYGDRLQNMREGYGFTNYRRDPWYLVKPQD